MINKGINSSIETLFIPTDSRYFVLRSSLIKEVVRLNGDISTMVPPEIIDIVQKHYRGDDKLMYRCIEAHRHSASALGASL